MTVLTTETATARCREEVRGRPPVARTADTVVAILAVTLLSLALALCGALIAEDGSGVRDEGPATDTSYGS
ncbi:hypothetical protein ACH4YO_02320 [Streptomyces noursei]|uniref:hypothetical protein n=1 Tax=Streptomyces noursei TaxID=1971 RepID=UPI00081CEFB4|nr:membrane protein [Streptomyces noursei ATCC 11455]